VICSAKNETVLSDIEWKRRIAQFCNDSLECCCLDVDIRSFNW